MENVCLFWIAINLQSYTLIQMMALEEKLKRHSEMLKQNFRQIIIRKYIQQVSHPASYTEQQKFMKLIPMGSRLFTSYNNNIK